MGSLAARGIAEATNAASFKLHTQASLHAFKEAFGERHDVMLLCFFTNIAATNEYKSLAATAGGGNILIVEGRADDGKYYNYLRRANCFISLHQETAIGYALAEAMILGKDVIATACGGNTHFMHSDNSFLVSATCAVSVAAQAVDFLISIRDENNVLESKGRKAKLHIQKNHSPHSIGYIMQKRIEELHGLQVVLPAEQDRTVLFRARRKMRRIMKRLMRRQIIVKEPLPIDHETHQTTAIIKILLANVIRPDVLE